jgi:predicted nucleic acid-binding Zn ribbon protein
MKVKCKICKDELDTATSGFIDSANKCEYCNEYFCGKHIHWENHECPAKMSKLSDKEKKDIKQKISSTYAFLILFLVLRIAGTTLFTIFSMTNFYAMLWYVILVIVYIFALIGVYKKQIFGPITVIIIGIIDLALSLYFSFESTTEAGNFYGSMFWDLVIIFLAYQVYKNLTKS